MDINTYMAAFSLLLGLVLGSFMNVCIYRIPLQKSIVNPGSSCRNCAVPVRWYDNIPLFSYMLLLGRCRECRAKISIRYPMVEALAGALSLALFIRHGISFAYLHLLIFSLSLVVITFIDLDHMIIPDIISIPGIIAAVPASLLVPYVSMPESIIGAVAGGGSFYLVASGYSLITGNEGMGGGDIKLMAMIGAWLGWQPLPIIVLLSALAGALVGGGYILVSGKGARVRIPFGPFLALGALTFVFYGREILHWYIRLLQV